MSLRVLNTFCMCSETVRRKKNSRQYKKERNKKKKTYLTRDVLRLEHPLVVVVEVEVEVEVETLVVRNTN